MNITLKQLEVFVAVARHGNLTLASDALFMTKGAVSQALGELERRLGVLLFDRAHPLLRINHEGMRLLPMADELVHRATEIERSFLDASDADVDGGFLRIGCTKTIGNYVMPELLAGFSGMAGWLPDISIANTGDILRMLSGFTLDAALLEGDERLPDIVFEPWLEDEMIVLARADHRLARGGKHAAADLRGERWILRERNSGSREFFTHTLAPLIGPFTIALTLTAPAAIVRSVAQGLGITFISRRSAAQECDAGKLAVIELEESFPRTFSLCYHSKKYHSSAMRRFLDYCRGRHSGAMEF